MRHVYPQEGAPVWIDLHNPTPDEFAQARALCGLKIPTREELDEIEASSRLQAQGQMLVLSVPITPYDPQKEHEPSPIGFVLTPQILVTIRFDELHTFHLVGERLQQREKVCGSGEIFTLLIEAIIDYGADKLELIKADTRTVSKAVFHRVPPRRRKVSRTNTMLRNILIKLGDMDERLSDIRETLLALQRAVPFVSDRGREWVGEEIAARMTTASADIQSLNDYEIHLTDKVQFLLDATLGFLGTEQNEIFKVLTIASIVGIPPVFVAGVYGMNFHNQPEYSWVFGYQWGWFLIILSTVLPIAWFKWRGWW